jgi:hypothetical protein
MDMHIYDESVCKVGVIMQEAWDRLRSAEGIAAN